MAEKRLAEVQRPGPYNTHFVSHSKSKFSLLSNMKGLD